MINNFSIEVKQNQNNINNNTKSDSINYKQKKPKNTKKLISNKNNLLEKLTLSTRNDFANNSISIYYFCIIFKNLIYFFKQYKSVFY